MIKQLIEDIAFDKITITQALTRTKLIARKIKNEALYKWVDNELNGYKGSKDLPIYRKILAQPIGEFIDGFHHVKNLPLQLNPQHFDFLYKVDIDHAVHELERFAVAEKGTDYILIQFNPNQVRVIGELYAQSNPALQMLGGGYRITKSDFANIVNQTKNRLLDTLLEFNDTFPNLEDDFKNSSENIRTVSQIINNHLYGDNSSTSTSIGNHNTVSSQAIQKESRVENIFQALSDSGVDNDSLSDLRERVKEKDKSNRTKKIIDWAASTTGKMLEKGLEAKLPQIMTQIGELVTALGS